MGRASYLLVGTKAAEEQRFGSTRRNTHLIGLKILRGRFDEAAHLFLCDTKGEENQQATQARKDLEETGDYKKALKEFPKYLRLERKVIAYLEKYPGNYANALRRLPRSILLLFIHALQSHIFNQSLSQRIEQELRVAESIQKKLLPTDIISYQGYDIVLIDS